MTKTTRPKKVTSKAKSSTLMKPPITYYGAGWSYSRKKNQAPRTTYHKRERFEVNYAERLELVSLDCRDALEVIKKRDTKESFFYVDPPYFNADQ